MAKLSNKAWLNFLLQICRINDARISDSSQHSNQVAYLSLAIAKALGLSDRESEAIYWAALLHDIGKIGVPEQVLVKTSPLDESDWNWIRLHPTLGSNIIQSIQVFAESAPLVVAHQEKMDGTGYPYGLSGDGIPLGARVLAVSDAYDAMTHNRVYRRARTHTEAIHEIQSLRGRHFDTQVVEAFMEVVRNGSPFKAMGAHNGHNGFNSYTGTI